MVSLVPQPVRGRRCFPSPACRGGDDACGSLVVCLFVPWRRACVLMCLQDGTSVITATKAKGHVELAEFLENTATERRKVRKGGGRAARGWQFPADASPGRMRVCACVRDCVRACTRACIGTCIRVPSRPLTV